MALECFTPEVHACIQVGTDVNAELLKSSLSAAGVKLDHLREVEGASGTAVILVQPSGDHVLMRMIYAASKLT